MRRGTKMNYKKKKLLETWYELESNFLIMELTDHIKLGLIKNI